jgi:molybdopterin-binding protein
VVVHIACGADLEVHLTPAAADSLQLRLGGSVWLVVKTYSCQVMQGKGKVGSEVRG